jgi:hypothetical protein
MSPIHDLLFTAIAVASIVALALQYRGARRDAEASRASMEALLNAHAATLRDVVDRLEGMQAASTEALERVTMRMADVVHNAPVGGLPRDLWEKQHEVEKLRVVSQEADREVRRTLLRNAKVR